MLISCKCLNITLEVKEVEPRGNFRKELRIWSVENVDSFFKEEIQQVQLITATRHVPSLIHDKRIGSWIITNCLNCSVNCYATYQDKKEATVVNCSLAITQDAIDHLQKNRDFSPAFKIIVQPVSEDLPKTGTAPSGKLKHVLTSLQHQLRDSVRGEVKKTEDSIRAFSEDLYERLEDFQNRATKDHKALAHKIYEVHVPLLEQEELNDSDAEAQKVAKKNAVKRRPRKPKKSLASPTKTEEVECTDRQTSPCPINVQPKATEEIPPSLDSEGLFYLEGMDDETNGSSKSDEGDDDGDDEGDDEGEDEGGDEGEEGGEVEEEEEKSAALKRNGTDSESHDEGIDVQHEQTPSCSMAISLPVDIPPHPPHVYEDKDEVPVEGIDIPASIKALALRLHGDAVFGDLPPPRLSTGI